MEKGSINNHPTDYEPSKSTFLQTIVGAFPFKNLIFEENSVFKRRWSLVVFIVILWNVFTIPIRFSFRDLWTVNNAIFYVFDYIADVIYIVDIVINFRTTVCSISLPFVY